MRVRAAVTWAGFAGTFAVVTAAVDGTVAKVLVLMLGSMVTGFISDHVTDSPSEGRRTQRIATLWGRVREFAMVLLLVAMTLGARPRRSGTYKDGRRIGHARPPRLAGSVRFTLALVPLAKRRPLADDLLRDRIEGIRFPRLNGVRAALRIAVAVRYRQVLERLNIPAGAHWWVDGLERQLPTRLLAASVTATAGNYAMQVLVFNTPGVGAVPGVIWVANILRSELHAARRRAGSVGEKAKPTTD